MPLPDDLEGTRSRTSVILDRFSWFASGLPLVWRPGGYIVISWVPSLWLQSLIKMLESGCNVRMACACSLEQGHKISETWSSRDTDFNEVFVQSRNCNYPKCTCLVERLLWETILGVYLLEHLNLVWAKYEPFLIPLCPWFLDSSSSWLGRYICMLLKFRILSWCKSTLSIPVKHTICTVDDRRCEVRCDSRSIHMQL